MDIKSALQILHEKKVILEPVLDKRFNIDLTRDCYIGTLRDINNAMKEYAAQFIELAAEEVGNHPCYYKENEGRNHDIKSILKLKEQIK